VSAPLCTIVVAPRERFDFAPASYESLCAHTSFDYPVLYVDSCCPRPWAQRLDTLAATGKITLIRTGFHVSQHEAFNLALTRIRTKYVVFVDYESIFTPCWLANLIACAEENGAAAVMPLLEQNDSLGNWRIHNCGGNYGVEEKDGQLWYREIHHLQGAPVREDFIRCQTALVEYHALLVRYEVLQKIGPFDEHYWPALDYTDFCLMVRASGGTLWFEPASVVKHQVFPRVGFRDLAIFMTRWSDRLVRAGQRCFAEKWGVQFPPSHGLWYRHYRRSLLHPIRDAVGRRFGSLAGKIVYRSLLPVEALVSRLVQAWTRVPNRRQRLEALGSWRAPELDRARVQAYADKIFRKPRPLHREFSVPDDLPSPAPHST
jgi:hypothetical protein